MASATSGIQSIERAFSVLLAVATEPAGITDVARRVALPVSTVARLLSTLEHLEAIAGRKGWRLPQGNPVRTGTVPVTSATRTSADFIINQIATHESTIDQFRAQLAGKGDAELKRALRDAVPGYQKNLEMLLGLKL